MVLQSTPTMRMTTSLPEVTLDGLILWRVRRSPSEQLWCSVRQRGEGLALTIQDPGRPQVTATTVCADIAVLVEAMEHLREDLVATGWQMVDVDLDEPD